MSEKDRCVFQEAFPSVALAFASSPEVTDILKFSNFAAW